MKRISWLLIVPLVLVATASVPVACVEFDTYTYQPLGVGGGGVGGSSSSSSGVGGSSSSSSGGTDCMAKEDCIGNECKTATGCEDGVCKWNFVPDGQAVLSQLYGDCKNRVCDGNGGIKLVDGDVTKDAYDWGNPCYVKACDALLAPMSDDGKTCETPWGNPAGHCAAFKCVECTADSECVSNTCRSGRCVPATCVDGVQNGGGIGGAGGAGGGGAGGAGGAAGMGAMETDVDCGGSACLPCVFDKECQKDTDCEGICDTSSGSPKCVAPTCKDGKLNQDETDVDCGGSCAEKCPTDGKCLFPADCESGVCNTGKCVIPRCDDFTQNGSETGVDCGGSCPAACPP